MHSLWLKGHKDKKARMEQVKSASWAFDLLREVLVKEFKKKDNIREYQDPQWIHRQIAANEYNQALDDLINLITVDKET